MSAFEDIKPGSRLRGIDPAGMAEIVQVSRFGHDALKVVYRVNERLVYRGDETGFDLVADGRSYSFDADGSLLRLARESHVRRSSQRRIHDPESSEEGREAAGCQAG